jgi:hypothetical protein
MHKIKLLFIGMDTNSFENVPNDLPHVKRLLYTEPTGEISGGLSKFRKGQFNNISFRKLKTVLILMKHGYDVLFFDSDVALLKDPVPLMALKQFDYVHQLNTFCPTLSEFNAMANEGNTGVYYVRANSRTRNLFEQVIDAEIM